jgi:2-iminoacetate synthase ThiH
MVFDILLEEEFSKSTISYVGLMYIEKTNSCFHGCLNCKNRAGIH